MNKRFLNLYFILAHKVMDELLKYREDYEITLYT